MSGSNQEKERYFRTMMKSKIHRATVTDANLNYEGSITVDQDLLKRCDILPFEKVAVYNVTNGERFYTYAIPGPAGEGDICINGAAAHKATKGDMVIIACYVTTDSPDVHQWQPRVVYVNEKNQPVEKPPGFNFTPPHDDTEAFPFLS